MAVPSPPEMVPPEAVPAGELDGPRQLTVWLSTVTRWYPLTFASVAGASNVKSTAVSVALAAPWRKPLTEVRSGALVWPAVRVEEPAVPIPLLSHGLL